MKNPGMEPFILYDLNMEEQEEKPEAEGTGFIVYFDEQESAEGKKAATAPLNVEEEARRVFEEAFAQGEKAGHEMGMKRVEPLVKRLGGIIAELSLFKEQLVKRAEHLSTELAFIFAEAIILRECREHHDTILHMIRKALALCEEHSGTTIRMRREDAQHIAEEDLSNFKVIRDDALHEPGFVIETNFGDIDGRVSVQIEELKKEFLNGKLD